KSERSASGGSLFHPLDAVAAAAFSSRKGWRLLVGAGGDFVADLLDEGIQLHGSGFALAVTDRDVAGLSFLGAQDQHIGHAVHLLGLADLVADLLVVAVQSNADAGGNQLLGDLGGVVQGLLRN